ncbi:MAG: hypothetical protein HC778_08205 [Chamaesiphon sp. CSU_1_12]|nr:hypothetical protein [Chamaesiphon sp. CSU_1_12]
MNTLDVAVVPKKGLKMYAEAGYLFQQNPDLSLRINDEPADNLDSLGIRKNNFPRVTFDAEWYRPVSQRTLEGDESDLCEASPAGRRAGLAEKEGI